MWRWCLLGFAMGLAIAFIPSCSSGQLCQGGACDAGCTGSSCNPDGGQGQDSGIQDAGFSACGHPGDQGNSLGVGKYCTTISACPTTAPVCSNINNDPNNPQLDTFFCVLPCDPCAPPTACGGGATCVCQGPGACGCTPNTCSAIFPDGGAPSCDGGARDSGTPDAGGADGGCVPSQLGSCDPVTQCTTGNSLHIGAWCAAQPDCTKYGGGLTCGASNGTPLCVKLGCQANTDCGTGACCTPTGVIANLNVCVPFFCVVTDGGSACPPP